MPLPVILAGMRSVTAHSFPILLLCAAPLAAQHGTELGRLSFPTSATDHRAQAEFERATLLLHSFEYEDARECYRRAQEIEPGLAIAHWGEALTHYRPIWRQEDVEEARAALERLAPTPQARAAKAGTDLERGMLGAVEALFGEGLRRDRWTAYSTAMNELRDRFPHHVEVGAFAMLAMMGTSFEGRDAGLYMRAAAVGEHYYRREPRHPGLLHYLIHCYDDPVHAPLGLRMARAYDEVAPGAEHALHMPSHIYLALGMWRETVDANIRSIAAADARRAAKKLDADARGWHAFLWQAYAHLQLGETEAARAMLEEGARFIEELPSTRIRAHYCLLRGLYAVDTRAFDDPLVRLEVDRSDLRYGAKSMDLWVAGQIALADGDRTAFESVIADLPVPNELLTRYGAPSWSEASGQTAAASCCVPDSDDRPGSQTGRAITSLLLHAADAEASGDHARARDLFEAAANAEDEMGLDFGPPDSIPAHEELAAFLDRIGQREKAAEHWAAALARAPGRLRAVRGAGLTPGR